MPWLLLFAARHADEAGQSDAALSHIDAAIAHTPTIQDLYVARGRVLKHRGQLWAAADAVNQGRVLDLADRYLNVKAVQYLLRAGRVDQAHRTLALFTRADSKELSGDPLGNVGSLEILWYQLEVAAAYERAGNYGLALKHYVKVDTIFKAFAEDQFDFHAYSLRKGPLRAYADVLALSDGLKHHSSFLKAMAGAARCYLALHEDAAARAGSKRWEEPALAERVAALAREVDAAGDAAPAGARAVVSSVRIAQGQVENARAAAASITAAREAKAAKGGAGAGAGGDDEEGAGGGEDKDLLGDELAAKANPLAEAQVYVAALLQNLPQEVPEAAAVSRAVGGAAVGRLPTPNGLVTAVPASSSAKLFRGWNAPPEFVAEAHALAARLAVERGKLLPAVTSMLASQRAAAAAPTAGLAASIVKGRAAHHLHPASLAASVRTYRAIEASLADGAASPLARVHEQLRAILRRPDQLGDAASTSAFVAALAPQAAAVLELADALQSVAGSGAAAPAVAPTAFMTGAAARAVLRRAVDAALSGAGSAAGVQAATKQLAGIAALAHADAATAPVVAAEQTFGASVVVVGEKDKPASGAGAAAPAKSA
jgi:tetratricopeptide (TPR) repeat protein